MKYLSSFRFLDFGSISAAFRLYNRVEKLRKNAPFRIYAISRIISAAFPLVTGENKAEMYPWKSYKLNSGNREGSRYFTELNSPSLRGHPPDTSGRGLWSILNIIFSPSEYSRREVVRARGISHDLSVFYLIDIHSWNKFARGRKGCVSSHIVFI